MANRQIKKAKEDLLEQEILLSKPEHSIKRALTFILTMLSILGVDFYSERLNKVVIARSEALHRMVYRAKRCGNPVR